MSDASSQAEIEDVRGKIRDAATSRDVLTLLFVRLLELAKPSWRISMVSEEELKLERPNGATSSIFMPNLWVECEQSPEERLEIVERRIRILAADEDEGKEVTAEQIVPLIRAVTYREYMPEDERDLISAHLAGDIWIVYACDLPDSMDVLKKDDAVRLKLDAEKLREVSLRNLSELVTNIEAKPYTNLYSISCENLFYASSLLLLDYVWEQLQPLVSGDLVVGIPARDTVLFTGSGDRQALANLREEVNYVFSHGHHLISESLLRRVAGRWESFS